MKIAFLAFDGFRLISKGVASAPTVSRRDRDKSRLGLRNWREKRTIRFLYCSFFWGKAKIIENCKKEGI